MILKSKKTRGSQCYTNHDRQQVNGAAVVLQDLSEEEGEFDFNPF